MLGKIKEFLSQSVDNSLEVKSDTSMTSEQKIIDDFGAYCRNWVNNENFPKKSHTTLEDIHKNLKEIDFNALSLEDFATIKRYLEKDIPQMVELYFSLPKAHAVSFILENGKTAKQNLMEQLCEYASKISLLWTQAVENKTKLLMQKQKNAFVPQAKKIDFFDL